MVLNETAERLLFPGEDPLGRILGVPMAGRIEIVGVVADVLHGGLDAAVVPELFVSHMNFPLHVSGRPSAPSIPGFRSSGSRAWRS